MGLLAVMSGRETLKQPINFVYPSRHLPSRVRAPMGEIAARLHGLGWATQINGPGRLRCCIPNELNVLF
jgi:hypothetical protein